MVNSMSDEGNPLDTDEKRGSSKTQEHKLTSRFGRHVFSTSTASVITKILSLLLLKILALTLAKSDYGLYGLWFSLMFVLATFSMSPFSATIWRFLQSSRYDTIGKKSSLITTATAGSLGFLLICSITLSALYLTNGYQIAEDPLYLASLLIATALAGSYVLKEVVLVISGSEQNSKEILIFRVLLYSGLFITAASFTLLFLDFRATMIGSCLGLGVPASMAYIYKLRKYGFSFPSRPILTRSLIYGGPLMIVATVSSALSFVVSFFVGVYSGLADVAVLGVSMTIAGIVSFIVGPPLTAYNAFLVSSYESDCLRTSNNVSTKIIEMFVSFATIAFVLIQSAAPLIITLVASEEYLDAVSILPYTVLSTLILLFSRFWKLRINLKEKTHHVGAVYLLSLVVLIVTCSIAVPMFGILGAGIALVLQSVTVPALLIPLGQRYLRLPIRKSFIVKWIFASVTLIVFNAAMASLSTSTLINGILLSCVFLGMMMVTRAHRIEDIKQMIRLLLPPRPE